LACGEIFIQLRIIPQKIALSQFGLKNVKTLQRINYLRNQHIWHAFDMWTMKDEHRIYRHPFLCIWSQSTLLGLNKILFLLYEQLFIYRLYALKGIYYLVLFQACLIICYVNLSSTHMCLPRSKLYWLMN